MNWLRMILSVVCSYIVIFAFIMNVRPEGSTVEAGGKGKGGGRSRRLFGITRESLVETHSEP